MEIKSITFFFFQLKDIELDDTADMTFTSALEKQSMTFSYFKGQIKEICSTVDEETWVTNIKRGVLSAFQNVLLEENDANTVIEEVKLVLLLKCN